ncbi:DUF6941 family protein [Chloroflexota bacterium]
MHIDFGFICDFADSTGKLSAIGIGFDRIIAPNLPKRHPHFSVVIQIRFSSTETGNKPIDIHLIDADGIEVIPPIKGSLDVKPAPAGILETSARLVMEFANVEFKNYGNYCVKVNMNTQEIMSIPITVAQPPKTA